MASKQSDIIWMALILVLLLPLYSYTQNTLSIFDFVSKFDGVEITIQASFKGILKKNDKYLPAHLTIISEGDVLLDTLCEIRSRGNTRKVVCFMPPTKIRLDKAYLNSRGWLDYPTIKIVNACSFGKMAESHVNLENLIYKIYNLLTDKSYRTKSVMLHYIDSDGKRKPRTFSGFLIEHEDQLADRIHGEIVKDQSVKPELLDRKQYIIFTMFQYLIGNSDWKVLNQHNLEIIKVSQERMYYAVPYDFDYAGLVNTSYAIPHEKLPIKSITERIYLGPCQTLSEVEESRQHFISKKDEIFRLIDDLDLNKKQQASSHYFINKFYAEIEARKFAEMVFTNCIDY